MSLAPPATVVAPPRRAPRADGPAHSRGAVLGAGSGHALQWFDWSIYATFSPFFATMFFPTDQVSAFLSTFAVLAVGSFARPLGGLLFGRISDRRGRTVSMTLTTLLLGGGGLAIGLCPTWSTIGWLAPVLLVAVRIVQGLAYGGDQPAVQAYLAELAPRHHRGRWSSYVYLFGALGTIAGLVLALILTTTLSTDAMHAWGWRVPFLLAGLGGLFTFYLRRRLRESAPFVVARRAAEHGGPVRLRSQLWRFRSAAVRVAGFTVGMTVAMYFWVVAVPAYAIATLHIGATQALLACLVGHLSMLVWLPLWGALSDRIGRKPVMIVGFVGSALAAFPLTALLDGDPVRLGLAVVGALVFLSAPIAVAPAVMCELFPTTVRTFGVAVPYAATAAVFGGTTPFLQTWLTREFGLSAFTAYLTLALVVSLLTTCALSETRDRDLDRV